MIASSTQSLAFDIVDVFSAAVGQGNPAAVVHDADAVDDRRMQEIASWIGLPETVFVVKPTSDRFDFAMRIFAPSCELPFAGHPALGALSAVASRRPDLAQKKRFMVECKAGAVSLSRETVNGSDILCFETPGTPEVTDLDAADIDAIRASLGIEAPALQCKRVTAGANWIVARFAQPQILANARPNQNEILSLSVDHNVSGITIFGPSPDEDALFEIRSFAPRIGVPEDAACGGGNACVAESLSKESNGESFTYTASQGRHLGRQSRIIISVVPGARCTVGGNCRIAVTGHLAI